MFKTSILALSAVALTASFASTAMAGAGADQIAAQLGVPAGQFTVNQMIRLQEARRDGDRTTEDFILGQAKDVVSRSAVSGDIGPSEGAVQLARLVGVTPGAFSVNDMIRLQAAISENDPQTVAFILGGSDNGNTANDIGVVTPAKAQLAGGLGLNPADYTTAELSARYLASFD